MLERILEMYPDSTFLKADGFDDAIIGFDSKTHVLVYSKTKCIEILEKDSGMEYEEAIEYFYFNVDGAYVGEQTPIFVEDDF